MIYGPLTIGQILSPSTDVMVKVAGLMENIKETKQEVFGIGFCAEYSHNEEFKKANLKFETRKQTDPLDRIFNSLFQDDKVATWSLHINTQKYFLSPTHTISFNECEAWKNELKEDRDVIIHSFEQVEANSLDCEYKGALSFKLLVDYLHVSKDSKTFYFNRSLAYKWARLN